MKMIRSTHRGFSLLEMLVSLAVLVIALGVVSNIFALTANTARTSVAISEAQGGVRSFMRELKADLDAINPAESVLILSGATQGAARTTEQANAQQYTRFLIGDPEDTNGFDPIFDRPVLPSRDQFTNPRTDIMAFFTSRQLPSRAPAIGNTSNSFQYSLQAGGRVGPVWTVYGHAALADAPANGGWPANADVRHIFTNNRQDVSPIPLNEWHLARRTTLLNRNPLDLPGGNPVQLPNGLSTAGALLGAAGVAVAADAILCDFPAVLEAFSAIAVNRPYERLPNSWVVNGAVRNIAGRLLFFQSGDVRTVSPERHVATVVNGLTPQTASNLAVRGLPGCAYFQVEFLMPEDIRNSRQAEQALLAPGTIATFRDDRPRWVEIEDGQTYIFAPDTAETRQAVSNPATFRANDFTGGTAAVYRTWPYAVRITIRVYDVDGRLDQPIVRTLIHRFP